MCSLRPAKGLCPWWYLRGNQKGTSQSRSLEFADCTSTGGADVGFLCPTAGRVSLMDFSEAQKERSAPVAFVRKSKRDIAWMSFLHCRSFVLDLQKSEANCKCRFQFCVNCKENRKRAPLYSFVNSQQTSAQNFVHYFLEKTRCRRKNSCIRGGNCGSNPPPRRKSTIHIYRNHPKSDHLKVLSPPKKRAAVIFSPQHLYNVKINFL